MDATETVDVAGLVASGLLDLDAVYDMLDLDAVYDMADWRQVDSIATYTECVYGANGDEPGEVQIVLESATKYGIVAYRWAQKDDGGTYDRGPITLDRDEAVESGEEYASDHDDAPDADDLIRRVVESGYFGCADADEIKAICEEATKYSQGYLLLPAGEFCGYPIGRLWTTNGYLQCDHVTLDASHASLAYAADALLRAVATEDEE